MRISMDLHIHSARSSDGCMSLEQIARLAAERGLQAVAVCDHGVTMDAAPEGLPCFVIPGVELATPYGHLLGLFVTGELPAGDTAQQIAAIHARGGLAVLAHPFEHCRTPEKFEAIVPLLDGMEVWNCRADRKNRRANAMAEAFAREKGLPFFAGSDAHTPGEIGGVRLTLEAEALTPDGIRQALLTAPREITGRRGKSLAVAKSRRTVLKKRGAAWKEWAVWTVFAAKCLTEDLIRGKGAEKHVTDR